MTQTQQYTTTTTPMHLTVDPVWDLIEVLAYGTVCDGLGAERYHTVVEDRVAFVLDPELAEIVGFVVRDYAEIDQEELDAPELWIGPRFDVPVLGLRAATAGEVLLAIRGRFAPGEPTADALHLHTAINTKDAGEALGHWRLALEAGDMKAHYAIGYTLCGLGRHRDAYTHLRHYTELTPDNPWAWCWLGQACAGADNHQEARAAYERAIELGGDETDAA
jgi:tetratricopeptide (TPR) repeat protein